MSVMTDCMCRNKFVYDYCAILYYNTWNLEVLHVVPIHVEVSIVNCSLTDVSTKPSDLISISKRMFVT